MKLKTLLDLARISNLPTVWSNVLVGAVLSRPDQAPPDSVHLTVAVAGVAGSLLYTGGMFLNDAFDAAIDARERPERPIPSGRIARSSVFALGFAMLALALVLLAVLAFAWSGTGGVSLVGAGALTAGFVLVYDRWHKGRWWSPVVMGLCRAGLYFIGALAVSPSVAFPVLAAALLLSGYVVSLTHVARFENATTVARAWPSLFLFAPPLLSFLGDHHTRAPFETVLFVGVVLLGLYWSARAIVAARRGGPNIGRAVVALIAGISLVDATFLVSLRPHAQGALAVALTAFVLTLLFQRWVRGT